MNFELENKWKKTQKKASESFGEILDLQSLLFMIGLQELNLGYIKLKKDQKLEVMHIAICTLLSPYGYYEYKGRDEEGWPHYENIKKLPAISDIEQEDLIKEAIIDYFETEVTPVL